MTYVKYKRIVLIMIMFLLHVFVHLFIHLFEIRHMARKHIDRIQYKQYTLRKILLAVYRTTDRNLKFGSLLFK